jgi:hypothetical protein
VGTNAELFGDLGSFDLVNLFVFYVLNRVVIFWAYFLLFIRVMCSDEIYAKCCLGVHFLKKYLKLRMSREFVF